ncbi:MAG: hypothetical protein KKE09_19625 [Bacteroidetes bacterium]|nr:hypothetical protein [Bacteroidota bacterium]
MKIRKGIIYDIGILGFSIILGSAGLFMYYTSYSIPKVHQEEFSMLKSEKSKRDVYERTKSNLDDLLKSNPNNSELRESLSGSKSIIQEKINDLSAKIDSLENLPEVIEVKQTMREKKTKGMNCVYSTLIGFGIVLGSAYKIIQNITPFPYFRRKKESKTKPN